MKIVIIICTRGKNSNLFLLIEQLSWVKKKSDVDFRVLVVWDSSSAIPTQEFFNTSFVLSKESGYASVRNSGLENRKHDESVLFIDDDERIFASPEFDSNDSSIKDKFITSHIEACANFEKSIFIGQISAVNEEGMEILRNGRAVNNSKLGEILKYASGGNMFIPAKIFSINNIKFDEYFNTGGEDSDLNFRLRKYGIATRWNPLSILYEVTEPVRLTSAWRTKRKIKNEAILSITSRRNLGRSQILLLILMKILVVPITFLFKNELDIPLKNFYEFKIRCLLFLILGKREYLDKYFD